MSQAGVVSTTTNVANQPMSSITDLTEGGAFELIPATPHLFIENQQIAVTGLTVDIDESTLLGGWTAGDPLTAFQINGTIDSYYLHLDTSDTGNVSSSGFIEFDKPVIGIMVTASTLNAGDSIVGSGGVSFEPGRALGAPDAFTLEANSRRLRFDFLNGVGVDSVRVITGGVASSGTITELSLNGSEAFVANGDYEGNSSGTNTVYFFHEQAEVNVDGLTVDLPAANLQSGWSHPQSTLPTPITGVVNSHYLFFDSVVDSENNLISGSVQFEQPVIGVIFRNTTMAASDFLAAPGVSFATTRNLGTPGDAISLDSSGLELSFTFANFDQTDDIRVITSAPAVEGTNVPFLGVFGSFLLAATMTISARRARKQFR